MHQCRQIGGMRAKIAKVENNWSSNHLIRAQNHIIFSFNFVLFLVKVEHRLTLFYLANDVIQYSKRKNYEFVESWGTALQRATTMVRYVIIPIALLFAFEYV